MATFNVPDITVRVHQAGGVEGFILRGTVRIRVMAGGAVVADRLAEANECRVRLQAKAAFGTTQTHEQTITGSSGRYELARSPGAARLSPGDYRISAQHVESDAEWALNVRLGASGIWSTLGAPVEVKRGRDMPATFNQSNVRPVGGFAFPEALEPVRTHPRGGVPRGALRSQFRGQAGPAFRLTAV